jgi:hypothetical protein
MGQKPESLSWASVCRESRDRIMVDTSSNSAQTMGFMVLDPNNDRGHQIDGTSEKGQEYQAVRIFGKDTYVYQMDCSVSRDSSRECR